MKLNFNIQYRARIDALDIKSKTHDNKKAGFHST